MVGEMRDKETAELGVKLANTGHLTFSTLHTNDAPSAVSRLYKMGSSPAALIRHQPGRGAATWSSAGQRR
jgi:type II secretory ATPase GspE/PulE/Tfp pilus assembly ATPase PilB-like protein